jgi:hypothetical protein
MSLAGSAIVIVVAVDEVALDVGTNIIAIISISRIDIEIGRSRPQHRYVSNNFVSLIQTFSSDNG